MRGMPCWLSLGILRNVVDALLHIDRGVGTTDDALLRLIREQMEPWLASFYRYCDRVYDEHEAAFEREVDRLSPRTYSSLFCTDPTLKEALTKLERRARAGLEVALRKWREHARDARQTVLAVLHVTEAAPEICDKPRRRCGEDRATPDCIMCGRKADMVYRPCWHRVVCMRCGSQLYKVWQRCQWCGVIVTTPAPVTVSGL